MEQLSYTVLSKGRSAAKSRNIYSWQEYGTAEINSTL